MLQTLIMFTILLRIANVNSRYVSMALCNGILNICHGYEVLVEENPTKFTNSQTVTQYV